MDSTEQNSHSNTNTTSKYIFKPNRKTMHQQAPNFQKPNQTGKQTRTPRQIDTTNSA